MFHSSVPLLPKQTGFRLQLLLALFVATSIIGTAAGSQDDQAGDVASAGESEPSPSDVEVAPQPEAQPAPVVPPVTSSERITLEQVDESLNRHPAPGPDQTESREHKALSATRTALREEQTWLSKRAQLAATTDGAEAKLEGFATGLESAVNPSYPDLPEDLDALELLLAQLRRELANAKSRLEVIGSELSGLPEKRLHGVNRTSELEILLRGLGEESSANEFDAILLRARRQSAEAELTLVKLEVSSTDVLRSLITGEQELLRAEITNLEARVEVVTEQTAEQRRLELEAQEKKARQTLRMAALQAPELQKLAEEN
ncbi:MAG: hypothetical protein DRP71_16730 [Verrucomicrobia bacterium]|nr:MAG: hypothetical protein DRP71_16730 [Verrucomicrobiota bacterium]